MGKNFTSPNPFREFRNDSGVLELVGPSYISSASILTPREWRQLIGPTHEGLPDCCEMVDEMRECLNALMRGGLLNNYWCKRYLVAHYRVVNRHFIPDRYKDPMTRLANKARETCRP